MCRQLSGKRKQACPCPEMLSTKSLARQMLEIIKHPALPIGQSSKEFSQQFRRSRTGRKGPGAEFLKFLAVLLLSASLNLGDKVPRAEPFSAPWLGLEGMDKGNVDVLIAPWNEMYFNEVESSRKASSRIWWMRAVRRLQNLKAEIHIPHLRQMED